MVFQECLDTVCERQSRVTRLAEQMQHALAGWSLRPMVEAFMAMREIDQV